MLSFFECDGTQLLEACWAVSENRTSRPSAARVGRQVRILSFHSELLHSLPASVLSLRNEHLEHPLLNRRCLHLAAHNL